MRSALEFEDTLSSELRHENLAEASTISQTSSIFDVEAKQLNVSTAAAADALAFDE